MNDSSSAFIDTIAFSKEWSDIELLQVRSRNMLFVATRYGRRFLLKTLRPEHADLTEYRLLHEKEFRLAVSLNHPNIAATYSYEEILLPCDTTSYKLPCIVQEYIDGLTLGEWLQTNPPQNLRGRLFSQLLDALEYLHGLQLVHHDLKPDNILITRNGSNLKLIDFGLSDTDDNAANRDNDPREDIRRLAPLMRLLFPKKYLLIRKRCAEGDYPNIAALRDAVENRKKIRSLYPLFLLVIVVIISSAILYVSHRERKAIIAEREQMLHELEKYDASAVRKWIPQTAADSASDVAAKFYACQKWEQQLEYVFEPARVRSLMQEYYAKGYSLQVISPEKASKSITRLTPELFILDRGYGMWDNTYIVKTDVGFKIDWEATVTFNPVSLYELEQTSEKIIQWRENHLRFSTSYKNDFWDQYWTSHSVYFYCQKQSKAAKALRELCADNKSHQVILKIKAVRTSDESYFEIVDFVKDGLSEYRMIN
ncbi:MAG: protein kinase [Paludibacteraceae bacterium]|nr:protein kinase [Paludibacteraceae bacterium]